MQILPRFDQSGPSYILKFPNCYHPVKYQNQETFLTKRSTITKMRKNTKFIENIKRCFLKYM